MCRTSSAGSVADARRARAGVHHPAPDNHARHSSARESGPGADLLDPAWGCAHDSTCAVDEPAVVATADSPRAPRLPTEEGEAWRCSRSANRTSAARLRSFSRALRWRAAPSSNGSDAVIRVIVLRLSARALSRAPAHSSGPRLRYGMLGTPRLPTLRRCGDRRLRQSRTQRGFS